MIYSYNPDCQCGWCLNDGANPYPGAPDSLGYDIPHNPPKPATPQIVALLSWYDEPTEWLARAIHSLAKLRVNHLIALDGAYAHYPDPEPRSSPDQHAAIRDACMDARIPVTIRAPTEPWATEIDKRNRMFELAETITEPSDWYFVIDADEFVTEAPNDIRERLERSPFDVGAVTLHEPGHPMGTLVFPTHPKLFRAIRGLRAVDNHYKYTTPDGRHLWGNAKTDRLEPRHDLTGLTVQHHSQLRHTDRRRAALDYYDTRDRLELETDMPAARSILREAA